jgi:bifunctional protein TilS/HprT
VGAQKSRFNRCLAEMTRGLNSSLSSGEKLHMLLRMSAQALGVRGCSILMLDAQKKRLIHTVSKGLTERYIRKGFVESAESLSSVLAGEVVAIADASIDPRVEFRELAEQERIVSILGVPLRIGEEILGTVRAYSRAAREFTTGEAEFVTTVANLAAIVLASDRHATESTTEAASNIPTQTVSLKSQLRPVAFAHPSEEEFARLLDFYQIDWLYEPRTFVLDRAKGKSGVMFTPDFYLPALDLYVEMTTLKPELAREKRRKVSRLRELYPDVNIKLLARRDYDRLLAKYGYGPQAGEKMRGVGRVLFSTARIQRRVRHLATDISKDYADRDPVLVGVLRGVFCFMADLMRNLTVPVDVDFMALSYYQGKNGKGVQITEDLHVNIEGRHVLLVEDIVDTGMTLSFVLSHLRVQGPASLEVCTLFDKRVRRLADVPLRYVGFEAPDEFLVGYGLDYNERYRNLPFVALMKEEETIPG